MSVDIPAPFGTQSVTFQVRELTRVEVSTLVYLGGKTHCLYLFFGKGKKEHFLLFNYTSSDILQQAYAALKAAKKNTAAQDIVMRPVPAKAKSKV
jgi:hypothetical protein